MDRIGDFRSLVSGSLPQFNTCHSVTLYVGGELVQDTEAEMRKIVARQQDWRSSRLIGTGGWVQYAAPAMGCCLVTASLVSLRVV